MSHLENDYVVGVGISEDYLEAKTEGNGINSLVIYVCPSTNSFKTNSVVIKKCGRQYSGLEFLIL
jgi:hypothetical protein